MTPETALLVEEPGWELVEGGQYTAGGGKKVDVE